MQCDAEARPCGETARRLSTAYPVAGRDVLERSRDNTRLSICLTGRRDGVTFMTFVASPRIRSVGCIYAGIDEP